MILLIFMKEYDYYSNIFQLNQINHKNRSSDNFNS
jgi:hypothetical protein